MQVVEQGYIFVVTGFACTSAPHRGGVRAGPPGNFWISRCLEMVSDAILELQMFTIYMYLYLVITYGMKPHRSCICTSKADENTQQALHAAQ